jgi:hypothetical protein
MFEADDAVSRPAGFHRQALARPGVRLSPHPAPIVQPYPCSSRQSANCAGAFSYFSIYIGTHGQSVCLRTARISRVQSPFIVKDSHVLLLPLSPGAPALDFLLCDAADE